MANNGGASSSILELAQHRDVWPSVDYEQTIPLESVTLGTFIEKHAIDLQGFDALILDTQGSELLILQGREGAFASISVYQDGSSRLRSVCRLLSPTGIGRVYERTRNSHGSVANSSPCVLKVEATSMWSINAWSVGDPLHHSRRA